jgi:hypothetical protein
MDQYTSIHAATVFPLWISALRTVCVERIMSVIRGIRACTCVCARTVHVHTDTIHAHIFL